MRTYYFLIDKRTGNVVRTSTKRYKPSIHKAQQQEHISLISIKGKNTAWARERLANILQKRGIQCPKLIHTTRQSGKPGDAERTPMP